MAAVCGATTAAVTRYISLQCMGATMRCSERQEMDCVASEHVHKCMLSRALGVDELVGHALVRVCGIVSGYHVQL